MRSGWMTAGDLGRKSGITTEVGEVYNKVMVTADEDT